MTKNQPDKLQIRSNRLTTKQSQIKTLKILPFSLVSSLQSPLFSLFSSAQQTTAQGSSEAASLKLLRLSLSLILCSPPLSSQVSTAHLTSGIRYKIIKLWAILFVKELKINLFIWALPGCLAPPWTGR